MCRSIIALDVAYGEDAAGVGAAGISDWADSGVTHEVAFRTEGAPAGYAPGEFYRRELPYLLDALDRLEQPPGCIVVDGYVWLGADGRPGLGARLFEDLGTGIPVIGVSKTRFRGDDFSQSVLRGESRTPLHVTAAGMDAEQAADHVRAMHGPHRIPTLLKRVDRLCRDALAG